MSTPAAKRRRLNDSVSALRKPFRSPLRTVPVGQSGTKSKTLSKLSHDSSNASQSSATRQPLCGHGNAAAHEQRQTSGPPAGEKEEQAHPSDRKPRPIQEQGEIPDSDTEEGGTPLSHHSSATDPSGQDKSMGHLKNLGELKDQIALLRTHPAIAPPEPLQELIRTWTRVARDAAEVLFPAVKDRVDAAGGVKTLRSASGFYAGQGSTGGDREAGEQGRRERFEELWAENTRGLHWETSAGGAAAGCERRDEEGAMRDAAWMEMERREKEVDERVEREQEEDEEQGGFTMGMMLRGMNIDFDLIGWDEGEAEWRSVAEFTMR